MLHNTLINKSYLHFYGLIDLATHSANLRPSGTQKGPAQDTSRSRSTPKLTKRLVDSPMPDAVDLVHWGDAQRPNAHSQSVNMTMPFRELVHQH